MHLIMLTDNFRVNTLVIGAGRSGTTSLCSYLATNPSICFSTLKEVHYFSIPDLHNRGTSYYHSFFKEYNGEPVIAGADTYLLMDHEAIKRIYRYNPEMNIIVMLRDPVERAFSSYHYSVNYGHHKAYSSFLESIEKEVKISETEDIVKRNNLGHFYGSLYFHHLERWISTFGRDRVLILKTRDMNDPGSGFFESLSSFLEVDIHQKDIGRENRGAIARSKHFEQFLLNRDSGFRKFIRKATPGFLKRLVFRSGAVDALHNLNRKEGERPVLEPEEYEKAMDYFKNDLQQLRDIYGIDLVSKQNT